MLQNLHELGAQLQEAYVKNYPVKDKALPAGFKQLVKDIDGATVEYNEYSFVVTITSSAQKIFFPNQLLYVAACFADYYKALSEYARIIKTDLRISDSDIKQAKDNKEYAQKLLADAILEDGDRELLAQFLSDYNWWYGGKGIERADYYISPILSLSKLVNASQSYVADLCRYLARNEKALQTLKDEINLVNNDGTPRQIIFYGAPGTGKSHKISDDSSVKVATTKNLVFRTTFHPDTDYATFVGCYKPKTHKKSMINGNGINETQLLSCFFDSNSPKYKRMNKARYLYEALVHTKDIRDLGLDAQAIADKLNAKDFSGCAYTTEATCMYNIYDWLKEDGYIVDSKLSYEFTPQSFIKAYVEAWKHQQSGEPIFLIIEEINRGNCAQIFGDIFQLLDRDNNGFSRYEISPDSDLQEYICGLGLDIKNITDTDGNDISAKIANGELMKLPNNLYIWATMNTSDQSLFPIDSAFKRRWEWRYIKITKPSDKNWELEYNGIKWWDFLQQINMIIASMTSSADKQLGYFFCKPDKDNTVSNERFVNKVVFYLWNDVFKDYAMDEGKLFKFIPKDEEGKDLEERDLTYPDFYDDITGKEQDYVIAQFIQHVMEWKTDDKK